VSVGGSTPTSSNPIPIMLHPKMTTTRDPIRSSIRPETGAPTAIASTIGSNMKEARDVET
jgi:hypothetical protein